MALRLNAEQKYIRDIFSGKLEYIIPSYQRAYSWGKEQCEVLFEDLKNAFLENNEQGYFLGNIVLAKSSEKRDTLEVIDGQQRLITITLLIQVLSSFLPKNIDLKNIIWINDSEGKPLKIRLKTRVFEDKDATYLKEVITTSSESLTVLKKDNNFKINIKYFYEELKKFQEINNINKFSDFLLNYVSLLPIESEDSQYKEARKKALKIFETINNRGLELSNADIFKAELYSMALNNLEEEEFIKRWKSLDKKCDDIKYSMDRIFKIYSYKIRGENGVKSSEIGLRDFFDTKNNISPFNNKSYNEIMDDLDDIVNAIEFFNDTKKISHYNELPKWFQLIDIYTNNYPKDLLIVYLSLLNNNINFPEDEVIRFSKSLVRYCYFQGATTTIKYYIYDLTINVMNNSWKEFYPKNERDNNYFGRLYKGFALLLAYLHPEQKSVSQYTIKKLKDILNYKNSEYSYFDLIGNNIPMDITKRELYNSNIKSDFHDVDYLRDNVNNWNDELHKKRQTELKQRLEDFFRHPNENQ
jgi:uncharacterized protein with ParB-like and HNH nuclease domain